MTCEQENCGVSVIGPTKTGRGRRIPLPNQLLEPLLTHLKTRPDDPDALVFSTNTGSPIAHGTVFRRHFQPAFARSGLPENTRWHDLRHTYASLLIAADGHPRAIMERLGHSSITVTLNVYGHLLPALDDELTARLEAAISNALPKQ